MVDTIPFADYPVTKKLSEIVSNALDSSISDDNIKNFSDLVLVENGRVAFMVEAKPIDVMDSESFSKFFQNIRKVAEAVWRENHGENELEIYIDFSRIQNLNVSTALLKELGNANTYSKATGIKALVVNLPDRVINTYSQTPNFDIQRTIAQLGRLRIGFTQVSINKFQAFRAVCRKMFETDRFKQEIEA